MGDKEKFWQSMDLERLFVRVKRLMRHVWKHFKEDSLLEEAASLSYTSLLATVPLLAVTFGVISIFPVFNEWSEQFQNFVFSNFVPAAGEVIRIYLTTFLESVGKLTLPGTVVLIATALLLMFRIEVAFNKVWRVTEARTVTNRIVMYWAVLTLCPIMIGAAVALGAQNVYSALNFGDGDSPGLQGAAIFVLMWTVFTVIFILVPNRKVQLRDAVAGAFLTAILFEIAKAGFVAYITNANYTVIYGALATIPIFLVWLYLVWIVVLFGASLAASLTTFKDESPIDVDWPAGLELQLAYRLLGQLWQAQRKGRSLFVTDLIEKEPKASEILIRNILVKLRDKEIVSHHPDEGWFLSRDLQDLTLGDLIQAGHYYIPLAEIDDCPNSGPWDQAFLEALQAIEESGKDVLQTPLRQLFKQS